MKKILRKILAVSASLLLLSSFVSCGEGEDDDDKSGPVVPGGSTGGGGNGGTSGADLWKDAEMLTEFANTEYNWAELKIDSEIASRLQVGSKVIFEIADCNSFSKFRVTKGWGQVGNGKIGDPSSSTPYYKIDGTKLNAKEALDAGNPANNHPGTWENEPGEPGTYYFVVDAANLEALQGGFDIVGCFKCVKIGITNLAAPVQPEEIADFATDGIGDVVTFNVSKAALTKDHNKITLRYLRSAKSAKEKITLKDAVWYVKLNDGKIEKKTGDIKFALNQYGGCFEEGFEEGKPVTDAMRTASGKYTGNSLNEPEVDANEYNFEIAYNPKQFAVGDVVKFQLVSAKVTGEGAAKINDIKKKIKAILVDGSENAGKESGVSPTGWYEELTAQLADVVYPRVIKDSAVIEAVDAPVVDAGLLEEPTDLDWSAGASVSATSFADVTGNKKIVITYTSNKDNDYHKFKMMAGGSELFAGIATGFTIDLTSTGDDLHGCSFTNAPSSVEQTLAYQPHETEWTKIKASGFKLIGHGVKITKIEVADSDVDNPSGEIETPEPETPPAVDSTPTALSGVTIPEGATVLYKASDAANSVFKDAEIQTWWNNEGALAFKIEYTKIGDTEGVVKVTSEAGSCGAFALGEGKTVSIPAGQKLVISVYTANGVIFKPVAPDKEFNVTGKADWQLFEVSYTEAAELKQLGIVGNGTEGNSVHYIDAVYLVEDEGTGESGGSGSASVGDDGLTKTSIIGGLEKGNDVWGSGTKTVDNGDGTYTVTDGKGWDALGMATMPVCFTAGALNGFTHVVVELDATNFTFRDGSDEYPSFELKVEDDTEAKNAKVINATALFKDGVAVIPLETVTFLDTASKCTVNLRGTGSVTLKGIYRAK